MGDWVVEAVGVLEGDLGGDLEGEREVGLGVVSGC